ncbi:type I-C CRISPR-associated protein Cas8c/Csd1 [Chlorobaculum limnaeum]|uniref:Type I-C CRISPR-associated protein Cas8c/Csd1 n=1 Tax=Chlorobaculum limnaeum TaxID=274537 RepID=A0A1D8D2G8_CHLLM|nr:type I-C CRISPR-associated protein Cas8c/Csd1 [Chlorobaculum limnaeum]AOS83745.1 type I-C CRISPR-associated protein Cas8c/Csd1 [Chlorobaculum limnaeum]
MILQALYNYYRQKAADPESGIAPPGFEWKEIPFIIVIDMDGNFIALEDTRKGKTKRGETYLLPKSTGRSGSNSWMTSNLLWDHYGYVLGIPRGDDAKSNEMAKKQLLTFVQNVESLKEHLGKNDAVAAVALFYEKEEYKKVSSSDKWHECMKIIGCNMSFRIKDDAFLIPCSKSVRLYVESLDLNQSDEEGLGICLLTGLYGPIARIHGDTPINKDSKKIVSFQKNSGYDSYGKEQAYNAPISKIAEFAYTTALNGLLSRNSKNKVQIGDITIVFWAERQSELEQLFPSFFCFPKTDDSEVDARAVAALNDNACLSVTDGESERFCVLGLGPNAARISVRFWHESTDGEIAAAIRQHFEDIDIVRSTYDTGHYSVYWLLSAMATENKIDNIPSNMASQILRAIVTGEAYPLTMLHQTVLRIRAMRNVRRMQAGILKAYLNRSSRIHSFSEKEAISMSLDETNMRTGYLLGRLFAVLEKIQEQGVPGIHSTIRDHYYASASSTPSTVFPQLLKMKNYHLERIKVRGLRRKYENLLSEIMNRIQPDMPSGLVMEEQARFALGYYHQKSDFNKSLIIQ